MANVQLAVAGDETTQVILSVPGVQGPTGSNIPPSGTTHQLLYKQSNTDYDTAWKLLTNDNVDAAAAIAGTKISPNFGSQNVLTTGTSTAASFIPTSSGVPTNGLYLPSANNVALSTSGTGKLFIDSAGKVTVKGAGTAAFVVEGSAPNNSLVIKDTTGNVGIGTSSPSAPITCQTSGASLAIRTLLRLENTVSGGAGGVGVGSSIDFYDEHADGLLVESARITSEVTDGAGSSRAADLSFYTTSSNAGAASVATEKVRITGSGNVGIGTTSPVALLQPNGTVSITGGSGASSANGLHLYFDTATNSGTITAFHSGVDNRNLTLDGKTIGFTIAGTERARIDSSGRLLVGTSSSASTGDAQYARLQVQGNTAASTNGAILALMRQQAATAPLNAGDLLGKIDFTDSAGNAFGAVFCGADGTTGANDYPGRLVFSVTADGASSPTEALRISNNRAITVSDGGNVVLGTTTGTKIGTATTQKLGFYNATPVVQPAAVADATDAATVITQLNDLLAKLRTLGIIAT